MNEAQRSEESGDEGANLTDLLYSGDGYYCLKCKGILSFYEQGLCCDCGPHWETEIYDEEKYPDKWVKVKIEARRI